jgi:hypothetical protein
MSALRRAESERSNEMIDLAVPLAVDGSAHLTFGQPFAAAAAAAALIAVLDCLNAPEITGKTVKL